MMKQCPKFCLVVLLSCSHEVFIKHLTSSLLKSNWQAEMQRGGVEQGTEGRTAKLGQQVNKKLANRPGAVQSHLFSRSHCPGGFLEIAGASVKEEEDFPSLTEGHMLLGFVFVSKSNGETEYPPFLIISLEIL